MHVTVRPGRYIVAVSGGVDSVVLLDILRKDPDLELIVAHFDHGIRPESVLDRKFVEDLASKYDLVFSYAEGRLGKHASEADAREARYAFLRSVQELHAATAIITAHHEDDRIETAIINMLRGTGRKGMSALSSTEYIVRPLLSVPKKEIISYAKRENLSWREDSTNQEDIYLRNYVRHHIVPRLSGQNRELLLQKIRAAQDLNRVIDDALAEVLETVQKTLDRDWFCLLPHALSGEVMAAWLRKEGIRNFDKKNIDRLIIGSKTLFPGSRIDVNGAYFLDVMKHNLQLTPRTSRQKSI